MAIKANSENVGGDGNDFHELSKDSEKFNENFIKKDEFKNEPVLKIWKTT